MLRSWSVVMVVIVALLLDGAAVPVTASGSGFKNASCKPGLVVPIWLPIDNLSIGDRVARGVVYFIALCYLFVGVSIVADRFMAAIEVITSQEKEITIKRPKGETQTVVVRVWNETVANLTLMALGSSAPEILLSIIEIYGQGFEAGELGPGTIVGSAAFNLFVIIAICVYVVPSNQNRRIKHLRVFFITATWSVFAYVWLYLILQVISPGIIEVWEALLTFFFFPTTVVTAYIADRRFLIYKYLSKKYRMNKRGVIVEGEGHQDVELGSKANHVPGDLGLKLFGDDASAEVLEFEEHRQEYINILRELRHKHPNCDMETLESMAREEIVNRGSKSRAFYRIQATRKLTGGGNVLKRRQEKVDSEHDIAKTEERVDDHITRIFFEPGHYTVMENVGEFDVTVMREGGDLSQVVLVDYRTEDGTANAGSDYVYAQGTLMFDKGETHKHFSLSVIDDDVFEEDEHFYIRLSNIRLCYPDGTEAPVTGTPPPVQLVSPSLATVMILDDDHGGIFNFTDREFEIPETIGEFPVKVTRFSGARGRVSLPFRTSDGTAKAGKHYEALEGELIFENNETEQDILIRVIDEDCYEKDIIFFVDLGEPKHLKDGDTDSGTGVDDDVHNPPELSEEDRIALLGRPRLGDLVRTQIRIKENKEFKNTVDKLIKKANISFVVGTSSWKEQFMEAITVSAGEDDDEEGDGEEKLPSCADYVMHFLTIFWKVIFAFVPPTDYQNGWTCFAVSMMLIGVLTAIINDMATMFGCTIGLPDTVTAIAFVALGTSVPDTFASKVAAINDKYADSSIGNVTGSNAVNVFLGLGIAWSMAAIYHTINGRDFVVPPGNLAFSVTLFCSTALVAIFILMLRRSPHVGGELGGPTKYKIPTVILFVSFWMFYVLMSSMESYGYIKGF
uniref:Sodium/calcium exchanger 3 n=1 Tax=Hemiscolopendra marginata TaxID=943146 RepID=A0A646QF93_9MYRI